MYSPAELALNAIGMKPATVTRVPISIGFAVDVKANVAALSVLSPASSRPTVDSTVIMASSTSSPSAMINAPREMRCSEMSCAFMTRNTIASTSGIEKVTTRPARNPRLMKLITSTMPTASSSALTKPPTAFSTTRGWSETMWMPTPIGRSASI